MTRLGLILAFMCRTTWAQAPLSEKYTMADLEALEAEKNYAEFFAHATDIRPSERTRPWQAMVENMGEGYLRSLLKRGVLKREDFQFMENLSHWSVLRQSEFFRLKRQDVARQYFKQCFQNNTITADHVCWEDLNEFWQTDKIDIHFGPELAQIVSHALPSTTPSLTDIGQRFRLKVDLWNFYGPAVKSELAQTHCARPEVQQAVWEKIKLTTYTETLTKALALVHADCLTSLIPKARETLKQVAIPELERDFAFTLLNKFNKLDQSEIDLYYVIYLLQTPSVGDTMNLAWSRVRALGLAAKRREIILPKLKSLHPLPGNVFSSYDSQKRNAIMQLFKDHFPEYLDYYAGQCITFYRGENRFPNGNPAHQCREFFEAAKMRPELLAPGTVESFFKLL